MSDWKEYSGIVVETTAEKNQKIIKIYCPDLLPMVSGDILDKQDTAYGIKISDVKGNAITTEVTATTYIEAEYLGSTNKSIPDMHIGEQVTLYQYKNQGKFFWLPKGRDDNLRKTEHLKFYVAARKSNQEKITDENCYLIELDTKYGRHIKMTTSDCLGEKFKYTFVIDTKRSCVVIKDNANNSIRLNSSTNQIICQNALKSKVDIDSKEIYVESEDLIHLKSKKIIFEAEEKIMAKSDNTIGIEAKNILSESSQQHKTDCSTYALSANTASMGMQTLSLTALAGELLVAGITQTQHVHPFVPTDGVTKKPKG